MKFFLKRKKSLKIFLLLCAILVLGAAVRFADIGKDSFWLDEGATALAMKYHGPFEILKIIKDTGQIIPEFYSYNKDLPNANQELPVYYFLLAFWAKFFGVSESSLRSLSALFGCLSLIVIYFLGKEIFGERVGILCSLMSCVNLTLIAYSQEARKYMFYLFISLLSIYFLLRFFKSKKNYHLALFIVATLVGIYTHYLFAFLLIFEALFVLLHEVKEMLKKEKRGIGDIGIRRLGFSFFLFAASYLPLLGRIFGQKLNNLSYIPRPSLRVFLELFTQFNTWLYPSDTLRAIRDKALHGSLLSLTPYEFALSASVILTILTLAIFAIKSAIKIFKDIRLDERLFLLMWLIVPIMVSLLTSLVHPSIRTFGGVTYVIYALPAYLMLSSEGILSMKKKNAAVVIAVLLIASMLPIYAYHSSIKKQQFREAAMFLKERIKSTDSIFFNINTGITPFTYYYGKADYSYAIPNLQRAIDISNGKKSIWIVYALPKYSDPKGEIKKFFDDNYRMQEEKEFFDIAVYHYSK